MSTRSYSGTLIFENIFDAIPNSNILLKNLADSVFNPKPTVVEDDCGTLLGENATLNFDLEGLISVVTNTPISRASIESDLSQGIYTKRIRNLSSCISKDGICQRCFSSSRPSDPLPSLGSSVVIPSEFQIQSEILYISTGGSSSALAYSQDTYDSLKVFHNGLLVSPSTYTVTGSVLSLNSVVSSDTFFAVKYYVISRAPFFYWLAKTYGGSLFGLKPLPLRALTLKPSLFSSLIYQGDVELLVSSINRIETIPEDIKLYLQGPISIMEKTLLAIAVDSVFSNATS